MIRFMGPLRLIVSYGSRACLVGGAFYAFLNHDYLLASFIVFSVLVTFLPAFLERNTKVVLPVGLEMAFLLFIFSAIFLGEFGDFYERFWWWDILLHGVSGLLLGLIGFVILFVLFDHDRIKASAFLLCFFSFCFALALGVIWEVFEFISDTFFGTTLQKVGVQDTMGDLILDGIGALWVSIFGYFYLQYNHTNIVNTFLSTFREKNPHIFRRLKRKILESDSLESFQEKKERLRRRLRKNK